MRNTGIATKVRATALAFSTVLALALSLLSGWSARAIAAPHTPMHSTKVQAASPNQTTYTTPGLADVNGLPGFGGTLYIGYAGTDSPPHIYITNSTFSFETKIANEAVLGGTGVGMCTFKNRPYVVWAGTDHRVNIGYFNGSTALSNKVTLNQTTDFTPSCVVDKSSRLWVGWTGVGNLHPNEMQSVDGLTWTGQLTDRGDTALNTSALANGGGSGAQPLLTAFAGTDTRHHINWTDYSHTHPDYNNWTNLDVEATVCCTFVILLYITWRAADSSDAIYYETWTTGGTSTCGGPNPCVTRTSYQSLTGIGVTTVKDAAGNPKQVWIAWGGLDFHLNVAEIV